MKVRHGSQRLPDATKANFGLAMKAIKGRFEPETQKHRYHSEFPARRKKSAEWADLTEDLSRTEAGGLAAG